MHNRLYAYTSQSTHTKTHRDKPYARAHTHTRVGSDNNKMQRFNPLCLLMQCAQKLIFGHWGFGKDVPWESSLATSLRPRCLRTCIKHKGYSKTCGCTQWWCIRQENAMRDAKDKCLDCACTQNGVSPCCSRASQDRWSACLLLLAILRTRRVSAVIHILGDLVVTRQRIKFLDLDGPRAWLACCP